MRTIKVFLKNAIILSISSIFLYCFRIFFNIYVSNKVGTAALGIFSLIMSIYFFFITLSTSGINLATTRIVSSYIVKNNLSYAKKASAVCIKYSCLLGIISGTLLAIFAPYITATWLHNRVAVNTFKILALSLPFMAMSCAINGYLSALRKPRKKRMCTNF